MNKREVIVTGRLEKKRCSVISKILDSRKMVSINVSLKAGEEMGRRKGQDKGQEN